MWNLDWQSKKMSISFHIDDMELPSNIFHAH